MRNKKVAIAGIGLTKQSKSLEENNLTICIKAVEQALIDAGMQLEEIDGISGRWPGPGGTKFDPGVVDWTGVFGKSFRWVGDTYPQGVPGILDAAAAVSFGLCNSAIVFGGQAGVLNTSKLADYTQPNNEFIQPWGFFTAAHFAMVAQVYFARFKPSREKLSQIAVDIRNAGSRNPEAVMYGKGPYGVSDIVDSPLICDPFHLLDLCLATEGASAILITSLERALDCPNDPIRILGGASEWHRQQYVDPVRYDEVGSIGKDAFSRAFATAALTPEDIDVYELYDINTWEVVRQFETLGLCAEGDGVDFLFENGISVDGKYPTNTDGGLLSFSHTGWGGPNLKIIEAVRQLRSTSTGDQIKDAETALVTGAGSGAQYFNAAILSKNR
ncbi:MAG: hypothetical protein CL431_08710 [Acidimicrobiaceae bacterium]|nr:hypothetical protein [Acidimicrobiaceae bacterium]|tara:strand:+ start:87159 stop:88316 length:1158 start_codon:yes stop_codon:yes gene_type:complete